MIRHLATSLCIFLFLANSYAQKKNVLFIIVDDLKPLIGAYGDPVAITPTLDSLAEFSTSFTNAYAQYARCGASRASFLTGMRPDAIKVWQNDEAIKPHSSITLPTYFDQMGFNTAGMGKIFHSKQSLLADWSWGFFGDKTLPINNSTGDPVIERYQAEEIKSAVSNLRKEDPNIKDNEISNMLEKMGLNNATECLPIPDDAYQDGAMAVKAMELLGKLSQHESPFFLAVGFRKPHLPFIAPKQYWDLYNREDLEIARIQKRPTDLHRYATHDSDEITKYGGVSFVDGENVLSEAKQLELVHAYLACVSYIDAQIGKILSKLVSLGLHKNTSIVLIGDHGFHLGDHAMWGKGTNFEEATRTPLMIYDPELRECNERNEIVELLDVFPTICDLTNIETPSHLQGKSLKPLLNKIGNPTSYYAMSQTNKTTFRGRVGYTIRTQRYRYTEWHDDDILDGFYDLDDRESIELYDHELDPFESKNLATEAGYEKVLDHMQMILESSIYRQHISKGQ